MQYRWCVCEGVIQPHLGMTIHHRCEIHLAGAQGAAARSESGHPQAESGDGGREGGRQAMLFDELEVAADSRCVGAARLIPDGKREEHLRLLNQVWITGSTGVVCE